MEHQHTDHPKPPQADHSDRATHTMPDGTVMHGAMHGENHSGHGVGHDHSAMIADFLRRFWICLVPTIPVVAISPMFQMAVGYHFDFPGRDWVS
jgi:Cu2+-exporting ATPase